MTFPLERRHFNPVMFELVPVLQEPSTRCRLYLRRQQEAARETLALGGYTFASF